MKAKTDTFYLVSTRILPESIAKTAEAKRLLESGECGTVQEAVERVGLSRSVFYKYKDGIYPSSTLTREKIVTLSLLLEHRSGVLSEVLSHLARSGGNILTINQTIPLQGYANVTMSVDTMEMERSVTEVLEQTRAIEGVKKAAIAGQG